MTRLVGHHPRIEVDLDATGQPARLRWEGGSVQVEVTWTIPVLVVKGR